MTTSQPSSGDLWVIRLSRHMSRCVAMQVQEWSAFDKYSLGNQLIRATDSIGLNISEGYARTHLKERLHFFSIAKGSLEEALFAIRCARDRHLIMKVDAANLSGLLIKLSRAIIALEQKLKDPAVP